MRLSVIPSLRYRAERCLTLGPQGVGLHQLALVAMGVSIFDNLDFERAAEEARRLNRYEFLFMAAPLRVEKGMGSPLNPLAVF